MKTKIISLCAVAAVLLLTACYHDSHEQQPNQYDGRPVGYLTPLLLWEDESDAGAVIDDIRFTVSGADGTTVSRSFDDTRSAAQWLQQLPVGSYDLLVNVDMDEEHGYVIEGGGTRAGEEADNALPATRVSLADPSSSPRQSWYAVTHATVEEDEITVAEFHLRRLLSVVSVTVHGVPAGVTIDVTVERVAHDVLLTRRDSQGRYGVAASDGHLTASLGALAVDPADPASQRLHGHTLMPTAGGQERCYLTLTVTHPGGPPLSFLADAPRMEIGMAYDVELDYARLRPYMMLSAFTIDDWTEGWTISGEVINPD